MNFIMPNVKLCGWRKRPFSLILILLIALLVACGGSSEPENISEAPENVVENTPTVLPTDAPPTATPEPTIEPTRTAAERLDLGIELLDAGNFAEAAAELEAAKLQDPNNVEVLANLGGAYLELDQAAKSIAVLEQALTIDPDHSLSMLNMCTIRGLNGDVDVIALCQAALASDPNNAGAHNGLGIAYVNNDQLELAAEQFLAAIEIDPDSANPQNNLGLVYAKQGENDLAIEQYQKAIEIDPSYDIAYGNLGLMYLRLEEFDLAVENYNKAIELNPNDPGSYRNLGLTYLNLGEPALAAENYQEALRLDPTDLQSINNIAYTYSDLGQHEDAIEHWLLGLELDPSRVYYLVDIALAQTELDQLGEAIATFEIYLEAAPNADNREAVEAEIVRLASIYYIEQAIANEGKTDFTNPASVLLAVFNAAAMANYANLPQLCDPLGENDGDTALICEITADHDLVADFKSFFATGTINGELMISGEFAEIPFTFGPENDQEEVMRLILRDGQWYLYDF